NTKSADTGTDLKPEESPPAVPEDDPMKALQESLKEKPGKTQ
ncbi:MAG: hypothetical protein RLZZ371_2020, partial [Pseudomonadota bacterium]